MVNVVLHFCAIFLNEHLSNVIKVKYVENIRINKYLFLKFYFFNYHTFDFFLHFQCNSVSDYFHHKETYLISWHSKEIKFQVISFTIYNKNRNNKVLR